MAMGAKVVGGSMVDSMVSMVDRSMVDSMVGRCMVDSMVDRSMVDTMVDTITKIDMRVGSSSMDSVVDRCSMVDRVVDSMVDSWVGRSMVDSMVGRGMVHLVDRMVGSAMDSMQWVVVDIVDKMGLVDTNWGSHFNLDFARDGFNINNRGLLDNSWSGCKVESWGGCKVESWGKGRGSRKGCGNG